MTMPKHARKAAILLRAIALCLALPPALTQAQDIPVPTKPYPDYSTCKKPEWPKQSLRKEETGTVTIGIEIEADGSVSGADIIMSSGSVLLDQAAQNGLSRCRFKPAMENGRPVPMKTEVEYQWTLEEGPASDWKLQTAQASAQTGEAKAQHALAKIYLELDGARRNQPEALRLLQAASAQDYKPSQVMLAALLLSGAEGPAGKVAASELYRQLAMQGDVNAQYRYGLMLYHSRGIPQDIPAGMAMLRKASAQGHWHSGSIIATELLRHPDNGGQYAQAFALLERSYKEGDVNALTQLAYCFETGKGVAKDLAGAKQLYQAAANAGSLNAKRAVARLDAQQAPVAPFGRLPSAPPPN